MLWNSVYPATLGYKNKGQLQNYLDKLVHTTHYIVCSEEELIGWMPVFDRMGERWFALLIQEYVQGKGIGLSLLNFARQQEAELNGWVVDRENMVRLNGLPYRSPLAFYERQGFEVHPGERLETSHLSSVKISWKRK